MKKGRVTKHYPTQGARNWARRKAVRMGLIKRDWATVARRFESDKV